jgi:hypothetical protein
MDIAPVMSSVTPFMRTQLSFTSTANNREVTAPATFPDGPFSSVTLHLELACPSGRCDPWDRVGNIGIVDGDASADGAAAPILEIARFITPYGVGGSWDFDVTDLQPLLHGTRTMHAFIDTWVGPGSQYGNGWLLTARFDFVTGQPARLPVQVLPLHWTRAVYGDPAQPIATQLPPQTLTLPSGFSSSELFVITTGHGQGNLNNCAEFCERMHTVQVDETPHTHDVWRDDCADNPVSNQQGTWTLSRAGWCPGSDVQPWREDLGTTLAPGSTHTFGYDVEAYVNSCRPDAVADGGTCTGCSLHTGCAYDDGNHTEPYYLVTGYVVLFQ